MKWTVGSKIGAGFALGSLGLVLIGLVAFSNIAHLTQANDGVIHTYKVINRAEGLLSSLKDAETGQRGFLLTGSERYLAPYQESLVSLQVIQKELGELTANPEQHRMLDRLAPLIDQKMAELKRTIDLRRDPRQGFEKARELVLTDQGRITMDEIRKLLQAFQEGELHLLNQRVQEANASASRTRWVIGGLTVCTLLLVSLIGYWITRNIAVPLDELSAAAERIANGDLRVSLAVQAREDEVGRLSAAFARMSGALQEMANSAGRIAARDLRVGISPQSEHDQLGLAFAAMLENLRRTTSELAEGVNVLSAVSADILAATTQVASSAAETGTAIAQTAATIEEVKQTAKLSSQKAREVADTALQASMIAQGGRKSVEVVVDGMGQIQAQMERVAESVVRLSEQGQAIGEIIATVNDLAEQSNLLAVNAAIEAAKAGDQGRGFTVVAQEIRSLAEQSKLATSQVRALLGEIQKATTTSVLAAEQGSKAVDAGTRQTSEAGDAIRLLAENSALSAQAAAQIAASSQEQVVGTDQVALAIENIKQASAQNMLGTRQAEAAAQSVHQLGLRLKQLLDQYQV